MEELLLNRVYIVDDDADVGASLEFFLGTAGFATTTFADPRIFMDVSSHLPPGCVLLDLRMPNIDGFEVIQQLNHRASALPVVVMTGHGDVVTAVRVMKQGALDFIEKPFEEHTLLEILSRTFALLAGNIRERERRSVARERLDRLTDREREVLVALLAGRANKVVAFELDISVRTVEMHRAAMMERLGVRSFAEALRLALEGGIDLGEVSGAPPEVAR